MILSDQVDNIIQKYVDTRSRIVLAFSGGLDSCVLLNILANSQFKRRLQVWHVNHGLLDCAGDMEKFCEKITDQYNVNFRVSHLKLDNKRSNLEALARKARYAEFEKSLSNSDVLLTAHHADDLAETLFLNLLRGSGSAGLRGIARCKVSGEARVLRPLLDVSRDELEAYASQSSLKWFEDPSNQTERFDRNFLRHRILPKLKTRWPGYVRSIGRVCRIQAETQQLLDEVGRVDYFKCRTEPFCLCQRELSALSVARQKNVIRFWLRANHCESLPSRRLDELIKQVNAVPQAHPLIQAARYEIRIYHRQLYLITEQSLPVLKPRYNLDGEDDLKIESINLCIGRDKILKRFKLLDEGQSLDIRFRNSEMPQSESRHRLKRLFHRYRVPPWLRDRTPQIFIDEELMDLWIE